MKINWKRVILTVLVIIVIPVLFLITYPYSRQYIDHALASPTEEQITRMKMEKGLCYYHDDCRREIPSIVDCNAARVNKYYEGQIFNTAIGCAKNEVPVCVDNTCTHKKFGMF